MRKKATCIFLATQASSIQLESQTEKLNLGKLGNKLANNLLDQDLTTAVSGYKDAFKNKDYHGIVDNAGSIGSKVLGTDSVAGQLVSHGTQNGLALANQLGSGDMTAAAGQLLEAGSGIAGTLGAQGLASNLQQAIPATQEAVDQLQGIDPNADLVTDQLQQNQLASALQEAAMANQALNYLPAAQSQALQQPGDQALVDAALQALANSPQNQVASYYDPSALVPQENIIQSAMSQNYVPQANDLVQAAQPAEQVLYDAGLLSNISQEQLLAAAVAEAAAQVSQSAVQEPPTNPIAQANANLGVAAAPYVTPSGQVVYSIL